MYPCIIIPTLLLTRIRLRTKIALEPDNFPICLDVPLSAWFPNDLRALPDWLPNVMQLKNFIGEGRGLI